MFFSDLFCVLLHLLVSMFKGGDCKIKIKTNRKTKKNKKKNGTRIRIRRMKRRMLRRTERSQTSEK